MAVEQRVNWKRARSQAVKVEEPHVRYVASAYIISDIKLCCRLFCFPTQMLSRALKSLYCLVAMFIR